jgi:predicted nuclease of predicted toxin-antitoxin system
VKILLDECIDRRFAKELEGHEVLTVSQVGWAGIKNGELLSRAQSQFDAFVTVDRNLAFQQNIPQFTIAFVVLESSTNRLKDLRPLLPKLQQLLLNVRKGEVSRVSL